eukprot:SAG25_NODE_427_length_8159_cov_9.134491_9_plen_66_part_00
MIGVWPTALGLASVRVGASRNSWARVRTMLLVGARAAELLPLAVWRWSHGTVGPVRRCYLGWPYR